MKRIIQIISIIVLMFALATATAYAHTESDPYVTDLTAGGGNIKSAMDIGDVLVWNDGEYLYVKYVVTDEEWCLTETHLEVQLVLDDIPLTKKGSPKIGHFTYSGEHACVGDVTYMIPLAWDVDEEVLIAAHGVAHKDGYAGFSGMLPTQAYMTTTFPGLGFGDPSYFDVAISGGTTLDGMYDGYCIDLGTGRLHDGLVNVYSSLGPIPAEVGLGYPENLDLINWVINQNFIGQPSACGGAFTYGDIQAAIWMLIEGYVNDNGSLGDWSPCRMQEILDAAIANGEGFVPGCGQKVGIILDPVEPYRQPVLIWIDAPCDGQDETAWGGDYFGTPLEFPGDDWSIYFAYTIQ